MKTKETILKDWLVRYTGTSLDTFQPHVLLVKDSNYLELFAEKYAVDILGKGHPMQTATADGITIINFGMGSPSAAIIMDLLTSISSKACLFLGKCGGLRSDKNKVGDLILPIAAVRGEGTSNDYFPPEVPALPAFALQKATSTTIREYGQDYWTGTVYTTNRRVWEFDEEFKSYLKMIRCQAIDMETATLFSTAFSNKIPAGALLIVSDLPLNPEGVITTNKERNFISQFAKQHLEIGIDSLKQLINNAQTVKHLRF